MENKRNFRNKVSPLEKNRVSLEEVQEQSSNEFEKSIVKEEKPIKKK